MGEKPAKPNPAILGFGVSRQRFNNLGIHPQLITYNNSNPLGPGQYHIHDIECAYKKETSSWKIKQESEEFSKFLGFRHCQLLKDRRFQETLGGPGTNDIFDLKEKTGASSFCNVGFGSGARFKSLIKDETLPPGTHTVKELTTKFNTVPSFEWAGLGSRFKSTEPPYKQAPNRYSLPHFCITDKVVSRRGPYDTFTGPRDETTIKNHFAPALFKPPDCFYPVPSVMDHMLHHKNKRRCGKFLLAERFPNYMTIKATKNGFTMYQKDEDYPSPAEYTIAGGIKQEKETLHPFDSSNVNARPPPNWKIHPGPDRYQVKYPKCHMKKGFKQSWMFISNVKRELALVESYSNFYY